VRTAALLLGSMVGALCISHSVGGAQSAANGGVSGVVIDSVAGKPLVGAQVQLVSTDTLARYGRTVISDSAGGFAFADVPVGGYHLGFFHPLLDSLGLEPILREVVVRDARDVRADLAVPGAARIRKAMCGAAPKNGGDAVIVGHVRDAKSLGGAAGVVVAAEWHELSISAKNVGTRKSRQVATTNESGWFSLCGVPSPGTIALRASRGADSTAVVEANVPASGFLRRTLYLGSARVVAVGDSASHADSAPGTRRVLFGDVRLSGSVVGANGGRPLAGARVSVGDGPTTRSNERGEWVLADVPAGTRTLDVRAVGYYPERVTVDAIEGVAPMRVALATLKSVLDTMKVSASRIGADRFIGFEERRKSQFGRFLTSKDIARMSPRGVADIFRSLPGVRVDGNSFTEAIYMRGVFEERCEPTFYVNGHQMRVDTGDLDALVRPEEITGIEIYQTGTAPPQFSPGLSGCGSIVFWTKAHR
jgi:hypothetical protein